jgi:hypothetical protein
MGEVCRWNAFSGNDLDWLALTMSRTLRSLEIFLVGFLFARCDAFTAFKPTTRRQLSAATVTIRQPIPMTKKLILASRCLRSSVSTVEPDYLITDSIGKLDRPPLTNFLCTPRNALGMALMAVATGISLSNLLGNYGDSYLQLEQASFILGFWNAGADYVSSKPPYVNNPTEQVSPNRRTGAVDDALVHWYAATYTASATWLALRTSPLCPLLLTALDPIAGSLALGIFLFSLTCPVLTLVHNSFQNLSFPMRAIVGMARQQDDLYSEPPLLTPTELLRAQSLLAVGIVGCIFAPEALTLALRGQDWWHRVSELHPSQPLIESSTALFGVYATQASMIAHRAGKAGVAPFQVICPAFAMVCVLLTIFPCACALFWLGNDISFFEFYRE